MAQPPFRRTREEVRKAVKDVIKAFNFKDPARTKEDATQCLMAYPFLRPHPGEVRLPDGSLAKSLKLSGTVGMKYKTKEYFVPCAFFLTEDYPKRGPLCYVCPTPNMLIKTNHQHVDQHGLCYLPYLHEWNKKTSHLCGSIGALAGVFEKDPFIYSKPSVPAAQPAQSSGVAAGRPAYTPQQQVAQPAKPAEPRQPGDADLGGLREQLEDLQSKLEDSKSCSVCFADRKNALIVPCGHVTCCMKCATELKAKNQSCPICRGKIDQLVKAFVV